ncbi:hypothetical protein M8J75_007847 [Diaphorina citri]|nr:hypothetical protein M8J75_007847 [Diaphorina citri]
MYNIFVDNNVEVGMRSRSFDGYKRYVVSLSYEFVRNNRQHHYVGREGKDAKHQDVVHCRHCGKVFCSACVRYQVLSGPNQRPAQVCETCHVILVKDSGSTSTGQVLSGLGGS